MKPLGGQPQPPDAGKDRPGIRIRPHAGLVRNPFDEIKAIKTLLEDVYKDAGDGRTLFREIVQNADDAGARRLRFTVLEQGWAKAQNSLLRGPAVLVANDGSFPKKDNEGIHRAIGGSKEDQVTKIGTFGIGLKSVFHICEAFLYIGAAQSEWRAGVLNPWVGTGGIEDEDPIHRDWSKVEGRDLEHLRDAMITMLGETSDGLLLWIPFRREDQLDRGNEGTRYGLGSHCPESQQLSSWFARAAPAALLLAQCGRLVRIEATRTQGPQELDGGERLLRVVRGTNEWVGRHHYESKWFPERSFEGEVIASADGLPPSQWSVVGSESLGADGLSNLQSHPDWPRIDTWSSDGRHSQVPRKALAHAAVTVLRPSDHDVGKLGIRLRWATFLPLDDDPEPSTDSRIVESVGPTPAWEIILHGYFWPSQDRKSIPGVTDEQGVGTGHAEMRDRWNRTLCEELLLPLLPRVLAEAVDSIEEPAARGLLKRAVESDLVSKHERCVRARHWLLPEVTADGVRWTARDGEARRVLSIPDWKDAPPEARKRFLESSGECSSDPVFVDGTAPRLAGELGEWTRDDFEHLLNSISREAFESAHTIRWVKRVVEHVLGRDRCPEDERAALFVRWLADKIGEGALATARRSSARQAPDELRQAWRDLGVAIPREWLVETPLKTSRAVAELAKDGVMGPGLFCMPTGRERDARRAEKPDHQQLDRALTAIGQRLKQAGESGRLRNSRLLLAKTLLSIRSVRPMDDHLRGLPILRATRLPDDKKEAWSSDELGRQVACRRVFARPPYQDPQGIRWDGTRSRPTSDPKGAVRDVALALGEAVWLVNGDAVASVAIDVPTPDPEALASTVLHAEGFAKPTSRTPLLRRLEPSVSREAKVRRAVRALLAGRGGDVVGNHTPLFVADGEFRRALRILLRLLDQPWRAVDGELAGSLSQAFLKGLSVDQADRQALHRLLGECLTGPVDWKVSNEDAHHLLESLFSADHESYSRWRRMPLHRGVDGDRGSFDSRARRRTRSTGDIDLPDDLLEGVRLLNPDQEVAHLYHVPKLDRNGALNLMLEHPRPWRYADRIVELVRCTDGPLSLPPDPGLRRLLKVSSWLPTCDGEGLAPGKVLIAPKEVLDAVRDLPAHGAFGDKHLPDDVEPDIWPMAEPVVREILGRMGRRRQVERLADALVPSRVAKMDDGALLVMSEPTWIDESLISDALQTTLAGNHPGWKLLHLVTRVLEDSDRQLLVKFAKSLCAPVPPEHQIEMLSMIADRKPAEDSPGGRVFRRILECFAASDAFFENVLPDLTLPTQDGNWHPSRDVAATEIGVARKHRPLPELRRILQPDRFDEIRRRCWDSDDREFKQDPLRDYFEPWRGQLPHGAVGAFLSLLGNGGEVADLAKEWLGEDLSINGMRGELVAPNDESLWDGIVVRVSPDVLRGPRVHTMNVVGKWVEMEADTDARTVFAQDPVRHPPRYWGKQPRDGFWSISLREVRPKDRTGGELVELLRETVEMWAARCLKLERDRVIEWWKRWIDESVVNLVPILASIKAYLPLTLRQLDVRSSRSLWEALRKAEQAQRKREQEPSKSTIDAERDSLNSLAGLIEQPEHQEFLWKRVNELMMRYGYREDSALLELAQNADDALAQAAEIEGRSLARDARHFIVNFHEADDSPTVDVMHWGRSINDTGGPSFPEGQGRQWDQDLYFMMLMHLSGKPGEMPGDAAASATTGRFGLGFKSVHLLSSSPSVVSGFMAFRIAGGLLPLSEEEPLPDDPSLVRGGRRVTRIRLPLRRDIGIDTLIESMFARFVQARVLLPVFARQIRKVVVEGGPAPGVNAFDGTAIEGAPGWSLGGETMLPSDPSHWRILRFRPRDAGQMHMGTLALAVGIRDGLPTRLPDFPFLWNGDYIQT